MHLRLGRSVSPGPSPGVTAGTLADFRGVSIWASAAARGAHWSRPALTSGLRRAFPQVTCPPAAAGTTRLLQACAVPTSRGLHACFCRPPAAIPGMSPAGLAWAALSPGSRGHVHARPGCTACSAALPAGQRLLRKGKAAGQTECNRCSLSRRTFVIEV